MIMADKKHSILIIEDSPLILNALGTILKDDYTLLIAKNGEKGISIAKSNNPSLILLDVMMPGMTGFQVIEILKADDATKNIPVIFLTGDNSEDSKEKGYQLGAVDYIKKPFEANIVKERVGLKIQG